MAGTIMNPPTPFVGSLPGPLSDGKSIVINGFAVPHEEGFAINLTCGGRLEPQEDTALHFNARFNEFRVIRNSLEYGNWGSEECHGSFPFKMGVLFEVVIDVNYQYYKISVDGRHFCDFRHRIPIQRVNTVTVEKGIQINFVRYDGFPGGVPAGAAYNPPSVPISYFPAGGVPRYPDGSQPINNPCFPAGGAYNPPSVPVSCFPAGGVPIYPVGNQPINNPPIPCTTLITGGLYSGIMINISGVLYPHCCQFVVNLQCGQYSDAADIALHFNARVNHGGVYNQVIRNSRRSGQWGQEEKHASYFPFSPNSNFDILILCEQNSFKIAVNNQHFTEFAYKILPLQIIDHLHINGDIRLTQIRFQ
ncbi:hypothetical protein ScPMuIL_014385 [Solemya velum]